jgi:hypothetical protein
VNEVTDVTGGSEGRAEKLTGRWLLYVDDRSSGSLVAKGALSRLLSSDLILPELAPIWSPSPDCGPLTYFYRHNCNTFVINE